MARRVFAFAAGAALLLRAGAVPAVRWIAVGGGADPRSTQVSLEQDLALARATLGPAGVLLFAGGPHAYGVQVLDEKPRGDPLKRELGDLLDPLDGRDSHYRFPKIAADGPASETRVLDALSAALAEGTGPLLFYFAGHGDKGNAPAKNSMQLWGDTAITVEELATALDREAQRRQVRMVITSCYSGGFADVVFKGGDAKRGRAPNVRCGLFASEWDHEASGCDPNPDRGAQEGYGIYFWHALRGQDRDGKPLPLATLDLDHDGKISLLEAHTRARIASTSIDVPTSTSERWLRHAAPANGPSRKVALPEEDAVIEALGNQLGLRDEAAAQRRQDEIEAALQQAGQRLADAQDDESDAFADLRIALLERWPVLDDPWHPDFNSTLRRDHKAIAAFLQSAPAAKRHRAVQHRLNRAEDRRDDLRYEYARVRRLVRAYQNRDLAGRLRAAGGPAWEYYEELLACERGR